MECSDLQVSRLLSNQWEAQDQDRAPEQVQERALVKVQGKMTFRTYNLTNYDWLRDYQSGLNKFETISSISKV